MSESEPLRVTVGILTYLRPSELRSGLPSVLRQVAELNDARPNEYRIDVLVVDNDPACSAAPVVDSIGDEVLRYVVEPRPGVSAARNRALDSSLDIDVLAFIDDDERPESGWLKHLLQTFRDTSAAAVAGRVIAEFDGVLDPWIEAGRFFVRRSLPTGTRVAAAGAGNLLLDLRVVRSLGLRFDEKFGLSGGEDTLFTRTLTAGGNPLVWCNEAVIVDRVPVARMSRRWVLARAWSHGNTAGLIEAELGGQGVDRLMARTRAAVRGILRIGGGAGRLIVGAVTRSDLHQARGSRAIWRGAGMIFGALGFVFREYDREFGTKSRRRRLARLHATHWKAHAAGPGRPTMADFVVLLSFPPTRPRGNPYRVLLENSLRKTPGLSVKNFSWRTALLTRYDVFHVHWPEILVSGQGAVRSVGKQLLFLALLVRLKLTRTPIVRTVHNLELPSGISRREIALLEVADRQTTLRIRINSSTEFAATQPFETIPHGHYRDWFAEHALPGTIPGRVVFFGLIRTYKGVDGLIRAFRETAGQRPETSLVIAGRPSTVELRDSLSQLAVGDPRIELLLEFIEDRQLVEVVGQAEIVVLPYREMHNSAGVLTALSLGRPVLIPDNLVNRVLAEEVGVGWVHLYPGQLTGEQIISAMRSLREKPPKGPCDLSQRGWETSAVGHLAAYRRAVEIMG